MAVSLRTALTCIMCTCFLIVGTIYISDTYASAPAFTESSEGPVIVIDPGHGGMDGGAVGVNGVIEKDINLSLSLDLAEMFRFAGYQVVLTRTDDRSIHDDGVQGVKKQKSSDLHNRLKIMNEESNSIILSIHQNQFSQAKYSGGQVFYGALNEQSSILAQSIQSNLKSMLQPENNREYKRAYDTLFLLNNAVPPTVLVECGFLSNPEEAELLSQREYQQKLAFVIFSSTLQYIQEESSYGHKV
jgi:N-acetylmuramoyl-L-alanine amidase